MRKFDMTEPSHVIRLLVYVFSIGMALILGVFTHPAFFLMLLFPAGLKCIEYLEAK